MKANQGLTRQNHSGMEVSPPSSSRGKGRFSFGAVQGAWLVLLLVLTMTVLEGSFRKWVFPQDGAIRYLFYFSKDIVFAMILFFPKSSQPTSALKEFSTWLRLGCVLVSLGALLSATKQVNLVGAVLTARALILLPVIAWLAVPRMAGLPLSWTTGLLAVFTLVNFGLGTEQNRLPASHFLNRYAEAEAVVADTESGVRATGTFSYISGMAVISTVGIWAGLALVSVAKSPWQRMCAWVALASGFGCGLASVSRAPIVIGVAMVAGWLFSSRSSVSVLMRGLFMGALCLGLAYGLGLFPAFSKLGQGFKDRVETSGDTLQERALGQFPELMEVLQISSLGSGLGTEQVGGQHYATGAADLQRRENPLPRLVMETGVLGLFGYVVIALGAIISLQTAKFGQTPETRAAIVATQLFLGIMFYGNLVFNHTASAFAWIIFAAVMASTQRRTDCKSDSVSLSPPGQKSLEVKPEQGRQDTTPRPRSGRAINFFRPTPVDDPETNKPPRLE